MLNRLFKLDESQSDLRTEVLAGLTTFMTMSYIIVVQPTVLSATGMDFAAVMMATCIASALACFMMGLTANYPVALAPAMGHNFFFAFTVVLAMKVPWQTALGAVFISGSLFMLLSLFSIREKVLAILPRQLSFGIAAGIGLMITLLGLEWSGIVVAAPGTYVGLGDLSRPPTLLALLGLLIIGSLLARGVKGAMLIGMLACAVIGVAAGILSFKGVASAPPSLAPTFLQLDIVGALRGDMIAVIVTFFFLDLFDTVGTLVGVGHQAGLMKDGSLPRARQAFFSDAFGTVAGALVGTSTVTSYIESASGVGAGGRTGLTAIVVGIAMLAATVFSPLVATMGGGIEVAQGLTLYPVAAPVLIVVGVMMIGVVSDIDWKDWTESLPAFLTMTVMPLTVSITEGIAFGIIAYALLKPLSGKAREVHWLMYLLAVLLLARYMFL